MDNLIITINRGMKQSNHHDLIVLNQILNLIGASDDLEELTDYLKRYVIKLHRTSHMPKNLNWYRNQTDDGIIITEKDEIIIEVKESI